MDDKVREFWIEFCNEKNLSLLYTGKLVFYILIY